MYYAGFRWYTPYSPRNTESRCRLSQFSPGVRPMNQNGSHNASYSYHHILLAQIPQKPLHCRVDVSGGSDQGPQVLLCVKETHFLELS
jgi:hypothetical protein